MKIPRIKGTQEELIRTRDTSRCILCKAIIPKGSVVWKRLRQNCFKYCFECGIRACHNRIQRYKDVIKDTNKQIRKAEAVREKVSNLNMCASLGEGVGENK